MEAKKELTWTFDFIKPVHCLTTAQCNYDMLYVGADVTKTVTKDLYWFISNFVIVFPIPRNNKLHLFDQCVCPTWDTRNGKDEIVHESCLYVSYMG